MLRTAAARLLPRATPSRQFTSSPSLLVRIRSSNPSGGTSNPNAAPSSSPSPSPSPAEAPPAPPPNTSSPPPFEPQVHQASPTSSTQANADPEPTTSQTNTPLTPPSASAPTEEVEAVELPKDGKYSLPSLDIDPEVALPEPTKEGEDAGGSSGRRRTGAGRKEYVSSIERQRKMWARMGMGAAAIGALGAAWYASQGESSDNATSSWERLKTNTSEMFDYFNKPAFKTLLPDPLPPPHQRPYTLVIDLEGLLVSSTWDRTAGWRTAKRPGVDYFLAYLSQFYEIVLFTSQPLYTAMPVAEKLDPFTAYLPYRLYRESTRSVKGKVVKDLAYLNRDLSKVIMLDTNAEHSALQPENAIVIKPWEGRGGERGLVDLIPFLESIGIFNPPDVRPILKAYEGKDIPTEYAKKEAESKRAAIEEWERKNPASRAGSSGGFLGGMFGSVSPTGQSRPNQPMTYLEQKRAQAQKMYQEEQKYWAEHAEEFKKLIEEDKQRQLAEMKGSLLGFISGQGGAKPEEKKA